MNLTPRDLRLLRTLGPHTRGHALMLLSRHPLLHISSAYRSPQRNKQVGGSPSSFHMQRRAVDLVGPLFDLQRAAEDAWRLRLGSECTGPEEVLLEYSGTPRQHLHVAW